MSAAIPNYRRLSADELRRRVDALWDRYGDCDLCPWTCGVDRTAGETGVCGLTDTAVVASHFPHTGEEPPLRGRHSSGTIFLAGCNLSCVFCQNYDVSQERRGDEASPETIASMALDLQGQGCRNVNFVTPTHVAPHLARAVQLARERGLEIPVVWNCGGYERAAVVEALDGAVDIYMPDLKWAEEDAARTYSTAPGYWEHARKAVLAMHRQVGDLRLDDEGVATGGLLVRHLVMPGHVENANRILDFIAEELSRDTYVNLMAQYRPAYEVPGSDRYAAIDRRVTAAEYREVVEHARDLGLDRVEVDDHAL